MDSTSLALLSSPYNYNNINKSAQLKGQLFDRSPSAHTSAVPAQFRWPEKDTVRALDELNEPHVDLGGFFRGDHGSTLRAAKAVREACTSHGFFQVVNHGIDPGLVRAAHDHIGYFFSSPIETKLRARRRKDGTVWGYSSAHSGRFTSKLPWKETLSFAFPARSPEAVVEFFESTLGADFVQTGKVYQKYCEAMKDLCMGILELLAISLGVERLHYWDFFEDSCSMMRCNSYPPCKDPSLVLGTGPHCDPTSITVLHQDQVGGLEVLSDGKWHKVRPCPDALVVNIGDTFTALTNGIYKSCLHRVVVNEHVVRRSLTFFLCPAPDKVVRPPRCLLRGDGGINRPRNFPDFTWSELLRFISKHHRADEGHTLDRFTEWILSRSPSHPTEIVN